MKFIHLLILPLLISLSCKNEINEKAQAETFDSNKNAAPSPLRKTQKLHALKGSYIGTPEVNGFLRGRYQALLNFSILAIDEENKTLSGHLITEGKKVIFEGKYQFDKKSNLIVAQNTDPDKLKIEIKKDGTKLVLTHELLRSELTKSVFKYDPTLRVVYEDRMLNRHPVNASADKLNDEDLENESRFDLDLIQSTIYARHGLAFPDRGSIYFFENVVEWYAPYFLNVDDKLTELEKTNIILLEKFKKLAPKNPLERPNK